ncbi:hypothetical protein ACQ5SO_14670 [Rhodovulum sp. DZ06]|uniref:hypothetical protein n=1 Tax=Rhodovulum sp. DZ06 TaxID=3425126 RepID=UPI003D33A2BF
MRSSLLLSALAALVVSAPGASAYESPESFRALVIDVVEHELSAWIDDPILIEPLRAQNAFSAGAAEADFQALELSWHGGKTKSPLVRDMLARPGSDALRRRREDAQGVITEIILMDGKGLNAAISDITSDVWQGDEAKFLETFPKGPGAIHVSELARDDSTGMVQTQVSMTVTDPETGEAIGAVTFGIDLERARAVYGETEGAKSTGF